MLAALAAGQPVISVDTKKKELIGNFRNGGSDDRPMGRPRRVNVHDFADKDLGKVVPYGVYHLAANAGRVSVGIVDNPGGDRAVPFDRRKHLVGHGVEQRFVAPARLGDEMVQRLMAGRLALSAQARGDRLDAFAPARQQHPVP